MAKKQKKLKLRFAADGRRTTKNKKTVMAVFSIMEEAELISQNDLD